MDVSKELSDKNGHKRYKCPEEGCNASYTKPIRLEVHIRKHTGERPFVCDIEDCTKTFTNIAHLKRHKCFVHEKSSEILCSYDGCGQVFNNKYSLKKHTNQQHKVTSNTFKCAHCSQEFKKKRQLRRHLYSHSDGEALKCIICNISFGELHLYNKHKRNHKTYSCDCGSVFDRWTQFCEHRKNSCSIKKIDHQCIICQKVFATSTNLKSHSLCHLEESQKDTYRCPYLNCKRSYMYKKNLTNHISVYHEKKNNGNKTISCSEAGCTVKFSSKRNLWRHIQNFHNGLPKVKKDRKPRRYIGNLKQCKASILSGVPLPKKDHLSILRNTDLSTKTA